MTSSTATKPFSFYFYKAFLFFSCFIGLCAKGQNVYTTVSALQTAVNTAASTGGTFILKDGTYSNASFTFISIKASSNLPILIKSETIGGVILTNDSKFSLSKCTFITVQGFNFNCSGSNSLVKLSGCNNIRFTRNIFKLTTTVPVKWFYIGGVYNDLVYPYLDPSHHNRIDHNIFQDKTLPGHYITVDGNNSVDQSQYDLIDHNYFKNNSPRAVNEQESIRVGWSDMSKSSGYTTIEYNLFENCDGDPEVVSIKSCDNIVRHNTFNGSYGTLSFRHGNRNRAEGNYFFGNNRPIGLAPDGTTNLYTGGIRVYGTDHVIINNYFEGLNGTRWDAPITLTQGDVDQTSTSLSSHFRPERIIIAYNTLVNNDYGIELGFTNNGAYTKGMLNITIANNLITGSKNSLVKIVDGKDPGSNVTWSNNLMYPTAGAAMVSGGTMTTSFSPAQALNENPNLVFDSAQGTWRTAATTPVYNNTNAVVTTEDIDGQTRPTPSNPGADHYSADVMSVRYQPMTSATVGPNAYEANEPVPESLVLTPIPSFGASGGSQVTTVTSNVNWTATIDKPSWMSINPISGTNDGSITVVVTANSTFATRTGTITVVGGSLTRILTITQAGLVSTTPIINAGAAGYPVTVTATQEQITAPNSNYASNTLDKNTSSKWSDLGIGSTTNPYGVLTYDLSGVYSLESIKIATTGSSSKWYFYGIQFSLDGINYSPMINLTSAAAGPSTFQTYLFSDVARYVKITGAGNNSSAFTTISEIEFYGNAIPLSVVKNEQLNSLIVYPNPASTVLNLQLANKNYKKVYVFSMDGKLVLNAENDNLKSNHFTIDVSALKQGNYVLKLIDESGKIFNSKIITIAN
ncbi:chondroitinase-B domain-containing protein [Flavobacterium nackdongense]|uniref:T9SS type A sorting domain-containing protein n=1 Tax=Flavobacterium nackdongense TaxID=2547394 RepID=A0A4P6Y5N7_9FLAO|nr:chondroitinase-B domain-containing protein [Flavobacterium nackdongense]QBN17451.1 T9SS type A sorting domain-containing protein [Flavobacterium nackdongense]